MTDLTTIQKQSNVIIFPHKPLPKKEGIKQNVLKVEVLTEIRTVKLTDTRCTYSKEFLPQQHDQP